MSKKCTPLWREAHFQVKMHKTPQCRTTFGSCDVEKVHAVVARSTCPSQNVQNTSKHLSVGRLLEVAMSEKCTQLWREAHFQVKMYKTHHVQTIFGGSDVEKVHAVVARSTFPSQNLQHTPCTDLFWNGSDVEKVHAVVARSTFGSQNVKEKGVRTTFGGSDVASLRFTTLHYVTLHYTPLHYITLHYTTLHNITTTTTQLNSTTIHYIPLH